MSLATLSAAKTRIEQLGLRMAELKAELGSADETMLIAEGFSRYELNTYADAAREIARQHERSVREGFTKTDEEWTDIAASQADGLVDHTLIFAQLRAFGIPSPVLGRIWPKLMRKLASSLAGRPMPVGA